MRPNHGHFHCFGCGGGGDVYTPSCRRSNTSASSRRWRPGRPDRLHGHLQRRRNQRAARPWQIAAGWSPPTPPRRSSTRPRLGPRKPPRPAGYLTERNFDAAARQFGCGFAPSGWDSLTKHLIRRLLSSRNSEAAGLFREDPPSPIDRFPPQAAVADPPPAVKRWGSGPPDLRRRPDHRQVRQHPPETTLLTKVAVLFGIDLAKAGHRQGSSGRRRRGYTDVMAMHLAGVTTAVASCGTAFGDGTWRCCGCDGRQFFRGELIYVFDGDAAGPCRRRPEGLRRRAEPRRPDSSWRWLPTAWTPATCAWPQRRCPARPGGPAPAVRVRDPHRAGRTRPGQRRGAGDGPAPLRADGRPDQGPDPARRVRPSARRLGGLGRRGPGDRARARAKPGTNPAPGPTTTGPPRGRARAATFRGGQGRPARPDAVAATWAPGGAAVPALAGPVFDSLAAGSFTHPGYAAVRAAIEAAGGTSSGLAGGQWIEKVGSQAAATSAGLVTELGVEAIRSTTERLPPLHRRRAGGCRRSGSAAGRRGQVEAATDVTGGAGGTNITPCSVTWSRSRPIGAACLEQASGDDPTA